MLGLTDGITAVGIVVGFAVGAFFVGTCVGLAVTLADGSGVLEVDFIVGLDEALGPFVGSLLDFIVTDGIVVGFAVGAFVVGTCVGLAVTLADGSDVGVLEVDFIVGIDEALGPFVGSLLGADVETATATVGDVEGGLEGRSEG